MLQLPLWFITERHPQAAADDLVCDDREEQVAFSELRKLRNFLAGQRAEKWNVTLASDHDGLERAIADAQENGKTRVALDPDTDGHGGELFSMIELIAVS